MLRLNLVKSLCEVFLGEKVQFFCRVTTQTFPPLKTLCSSSVCTGAGLTSAFPPVTGDVRVELGKASRPPSVPTPQRHESAKKAAAVWRKAAFRRQSFADGASVAL